MSVLPKDTIKVIAETVGISNLSEEVASGLAPDVEYRLREIIQEACKFMRHSKRDTLSTDDINAALRLRNIEALYGFSSALHAGHGESSASQQTGTHGRHHHSQHPLRFVQALGAKDVFYIEDQEIDFAKIISAPLPKAPRDASLTAHWLAIEGVQPAIRQNPAPDAEHVAPKRRKLSMSTSGAADKASGKSSALDAEKSEKDKPDSIVAGGVDVRPLVKHVLSRELQLYYTKITDSLRNTDQLFDLAMQSLAADPGLHGLVPYLARFIGEEVTLNINNLPILKKLMRMVHALLKNPNMQIEPYLHQLMPPILTCLVGKSLCDNSAADDHWSLRDDAADIASAICRRFGDSYKNLQPRITKTLLNAFLDPNKPLTTHYGAIVGLTALGPPVIQLLIVPNLTVYMSNILEPAQKEAELVVSAAAATAAAIDAATRRKETRKVYAALLQATGVWLQSATALLKAPLLKDKAEPLLVSGTAPMETDEGSATEGGRAPSVAAADPLRKLLMVIMPEFTQHYEQLRNIFGEQLDPFLARKDNHLSSIGVL